MGDWRQAYAASARNDVQGLIALKETGQQITLPDPISLCTPIFVAASTGKCDALTYLLRQKEGRHAMNNKTLKGATAVLAAAKNGHLQILEMLTNAGADLLEADEDGMTPLMHAVYEGQLKCIEFFVEVLDDSDEAINGRNAVGTSAVWIAVSRGDEAIISLLRKAGGVLGPMPPAGARSFVPQPHKPTTVSNNQASESTLPSILKLPVHTEDANSKALRLRKACETGDMAFLLHFAADGEPMDRADTRGKTPLRFAAEYDHPDCVRFLISRGAEPEARDRARQETPLHAAAKCGNHASVSVLLECGADVTSKRGGDLATPLFLACDGGHGETVSVLLADDRCDPDARSSTGVRPLEAACAKNHRLVATLLLDFGVTSLISDQHWLGLRFSNFLVRKQLGEVIAKQRASDEQEAREAEERALEEERKRIEAEELVLENAAKHKGKGGKQKGKKKGKK